MLIIWEQRSHDQAPSPAKDDRHLIELQTGHSRAPRNALRMGKTTTVSPKLYSRLSKIAHLWDCRSAPRPADSIDDCSVAPARKSRGLPGDDPRRRGFVTLRLTTRKASNATHIVLHSSLGREQSYSSSSRLNMANSTSGISLANFSGSGSTIIFRNISSQDTNLMSRTESSTNEKSSMSLYGCPL
jgi:hypothetical protein